MHNGFGFSSFLFSFFENKFVAVFGFVLALGDNNLMAAKTSRKLRLLLTQATGFIVPHILQSCQEIKVDFRRHNLRG